jgi:positive phototaxis protein PixI
MLNQQQFLRFQLQPFDFTQGTSNLMALMEIDLVTELVNIQIDRVVPMPHLPPAVMGVYNWRGEILWIVDLAMSMGMRGSPLRTRSLQPTIVLTSRVTPENPVQKTVGLAVNEIAEIEWFDPDLIQSPVSTQIQPELSRWVSGWLVSATGENLSILDGQKIANRSDFHSDI